jgi:hypothetical protein
MTTTLYTVADGSGFIKEEIPQGISFDECIF